MSYDYPMKVERRNHSMRTQAAIERWLEVAKDYKDKVPTDVIRNKYRNKRTGKPMSRSHLYYILDRLEELDIAF